MTSSVELNFGRMGQAIPFRFTVMWFGRAVGSWTWERASRRGAADVRAVPSLPAVWGSRHSDYQMDSNAFDAPATMP